MSDVFSPYQIDYSVKNTSKTFGFSKKKITFKFGIGNPSAIASGQSGANCRGSEHEIIFTWSLNSGKRQIMCDGKDIHYSESGQNGWTADQVFQHHFQLRVAGLSAPLRAHLITQPANKDVPHIKPFDLRLNGVSYFMMPQIFQLGTPQMVVRPVKGKGTFGGRGYSSYNNNEDAYLSPQERQAIAAAKLASMQDMNRGPAPAPAPVVVEDLLSFDTPAPAPAAPPNPYGQQYPPPQQPAYSNYSLGGAQPQQGYYGQPAPAPPPQQPMQQPNPYGQPPPQQPMQQSQSGSFSYGQPQQPQYNVSSPTTKSVASYQSYGSAPTFAQPPQAQQQQQPPQQQQYMQQQQQPGSYFGRPAY